MVYYLILLNIVKDKSYSLFCILFCINNADCGFLELKRVTIAIAIVIHSHP